MAIVTLDKICLNYGDNVLLDNVNIAIDAGDKIALIGRNGSGKSSLLKIINQEIKADSGVIHYAANITLAYLHQEPQLNITNTIFQEILSTYGEIANSLLEYDNIINQLNDKALAPNTDEDQLNNRLHELQTVLDDNHAWQIKQQVMQIITSLNLNESSLISDISGGMCKKIALAKIFLLKADVLLLDEPTNHLDINTIEWLESIINSYSGSVILITHDRDFLDKTVNKILELDRGDIKMYPDSYDKYLEYKASQLAVEKKNNSEFNKFLAKEEVWIRKGIEARRTRNEGRVRRLQELRRQKDNRKETLGNINFNLNRSDLSGKLIAKLENVHFSFMNNIIIDQLDTQIMRGDKVALIGNNGIGKSTLLKLILGQLKATSGKITLGTNLQIAYFDQMRQALDNEATIQDVINQGQDYIEINNRKIHISTYLADFLFDPASFRTKVKSLSGGEKNRLLLARLFSLPSNVLILDEPTNDLDINTLELLEEMLVKYTGTIFLVSHDRAFLDNVASKSFVFLGNGKILELLGGYSSYIDYKKIHDDKSFNNNGSGKNINKNNYSSGINTTDNNVVNNGNIINKVIKKLSYKEQKELQELPQKIEQLELEEKQINEYLSNNASYKDNLTKTLEYQKRLIQITEELQKSLIKWESLENK